MEYKKIKRAFYNFLQKHNAYTTYKHYRHNANVNLEDYWSRSRPEPRDFICQAFEWCRTAEGDDYWYKLHMLWQTVCANLHYNK